VLIVGLGNDLRGDDAVGVLVARRLAAEGVPASVEVREEQGDASELLEAWRDRTAVILVDALRSGAATGSRLRLEAGTTPLPRALRGSTSTHAVSLAEAIELARALGSLPGHVVVHAVEGGRFAPGAAPSPEVTAAVPAVAAAVRAEARALAAP
jgi:hydrogenase maturation protease